MHVSLSSATCFVSRSLGVTDGAKVTGVGPELEHFHHPGFYTLTTLPLFCFRVRLDNLRQKKTNRIPPVRAVMSHWYSIQEEFYYIMARVEIHSVLQPRNHIGDPQAQRDWKRTQRLL